MSKSSGAGPFVAGALAIAAVVAGVWYVNRDQPAPVAVQTLPVAEPVAEAPPPAPIAHPIEDAVRDTPAVAVADAEPLPALHESDAALLEALVALLDAESLGALVNHEFVIQRIVATVDSLPRARVAPQVVPLRPVAGRFAVAPGEDARLDPANYARYAPYVRVADRVDARAAVDVYVRYYPLFQQAYRELGIPDGYFNDRLIEVIDHLLAAPDVVGPIALVRPKVFFEYADPRLQERSAGQRLLIRMGPENAAILKAKLRAIRAELTSTPPAVADGG